MRNAKNVYRIGNKGFSLIEMLMVVGVMSVITVGIMELLQNATKGNKSVSLTAALDQTMTELQMALKNPVVCQGNIADFSPNLFDPGIPTSTISVQKISALTNMIIENNGALRNAPGTKVTISIENFNDIGAGNYIGQLTVSLDKGLNSVGGAVIKRQIPLSINTTGAAPAVTITGCSATVVLSGGGAAAAAAGIVYGSCPEGSLMAGFNSSGVECRPVTAPIAAVPVTAYTLESPGPGCTGTACVARDYGICNGTACVTNGSTCIGIACIAKGR